ncbi:MAG: alpha/beta hydrolase [Cytophagales bacterium]|nr:alpha/beta hydrolase [Cytophagales bacterium]
MPIIQHPAGHTLHYLKSGKGNKVVLFFHGFGQSSSAFGRVAELLPNHTVYFFDLFFHGESKWQSEKPIQKSDWKELIQTFLTDNQIEKFDLVAFSIGCRFALTTAEIFPAQTQHLILLAADGLRFRFWYWLATYPYLLRKYFKTLVTNPHRWNRLLHTVEFLRLIDRKLLRFAQRQMNTPEKRLQVYNSWVSFRHLKSSAASLQLLVRNHKVAVILIAGTRDKIVPARLISRQAEKINGAQVFGIAAGHHDLIALSQPILQTILNH